MTGITEGQVHEAIARLLAAGLKPTLRAIRTRLGGKGSLETINDHKKTYPDLLSLPPVRLADLVRDEVARALSDLEVLRVLATRLATLELTGQIEGIPVPFTERSDAALRPIETADGRTKTSVGPPTPDATAELKRRTRARIDDAFNNSARTRKDHKQ